MEESLRLKQKAADMWDKAETAYADTKNLAPNYVQTHHQMGLLFVKRAEQAMQQHQHRPVAFVNKLKIIFLPDVVLHNARFKSR